MALLYGRAGRLTGTNGGFRPGQAGSAALPARARWQCGLVPGSVASSLCMTAQPLYTRLADIFSASVSDATMRPDPRFDPAAPKGELQLRVRAAAIPWVAQLAAEAAAAAGQRGGARRPRRG